MTEPLSPSTGLAVVHLFWRRSPLVDPEQVRTAVAAVTESGAQVVPVCVLGHKAEFALMALGEDLWSLHDLQLAVVDAGLDLVDSYVSLTELSEYAQGVPEEMRQARLHPLLPPEGKRAFCFYPMSKRRNVEQNWFTLPYEERTRLMYEHGASGRKFSGRILQVVTGSTGVDDYEWGVTLFGERPDDIKETVYTMRYDEASAVYAEFGPFYTGMVCPLDDFIERLGSPS